MIRSTDGGKLPPGADIATDLGFELPPDTTPRSPPEIAATKIVFTSGWRLNHAKTCRRQRVQLERAGSGRLRGAVDNGQQVCVIESPRQRRRRATTSSAARQCEAWLSPSSATVAVARRFATPNAHTCSGSIRSMIVQGAFVAVAGLQRRRDHREPQLAFRHGRSGSRAAAPKQRGLEATKARDARSASRTSRSTYGVAGRRDERATGSATTAPAAANVGAGRASDGRL